MKEKILIFIIGFLAGAVLSTTVFLIYTKVNIGNSTNTSEIGRPEMGEPPEMGGEPPEKPDQENGERPERPSKNNEEGSSEESTRKRHSKNENTDSSKEETKEDKGV